MAAARSVAAVLDGRDLGQARGSAEELVALVAPKPPYYLAQCRTLEIWDCLGANAPRSAALDVSGSCHALREARQRTRSLRDASEAVSLRRLLMLTCRWSVGGTDGDQAPLRIVTVSCSVRMKQVLVVVPA